MPIGWCTTRRDAFGGRDVDIARIRLFVDDAFLC